MKIGLDYICRGVLILLQDVFLKHYFYKIHVSLGRTPRDYKLVNQSNISIQQARNGSLVIREAQENHEGYYLCQASNGVGQELSKVVYLDVQGKISLL